MVTLSEKDFSMKIPILYNKKLIWNNSPEF